MQIASKIFNNAIIVKTHVSPTSYNVESGRHNRRHLHRSTEAANITDQCSDLIVDDSTPHPNNSMLSSVTELGDWPSSLQPASPTISSAGISQPDKLHTTRSGCFAVLRTLSLCHQVESLTIIIDLRTLDTC